MNLLSFILTMCLLCSCTSSRSGREEMMEVVSSSRYTLREAKPGPKLEYRAATDEEITCPRISPLMKKCHFVY